MEQDPRFGMYSQPEPQKDEDSKKFLITIIVMLSVALVGLAALYIYNVSKNSQGEEETKKIETTSNIPVSPSPSVIPTTPPVVSEPEKIVPEETKKADLYVKSYSFNKDPRVGSEFTITIVIGNKGQIASPEFYWEWWSTSSKQSCKKKVGAISAGGTSTVGCEFTYSDWSDYATKVVVDSQNDVSESDEGNNTATKQVTPKHKKADLTVTEYDFNHDPKMGEDFKITITIKNEGQTDAKDFEWEYWGASALKLCDGEIDELEAGESTTVSCTKRYDGCSGAYVMKIIADVDDDIDEEEEDNNTLTKTISVPCT